MATTTTDAMLLADFLWSSLHAAKLRPSNVDPAAETLEVQRIVPQIHNAGQRLRLLCAATVPARDEIMSWCEEHNVDYVLGLPSNQRLQRMTHELESKSKAEFERCQTVAPPLRPTPWFRSLSTAP